MYDVRCTLYDVRCTMNDGLELVPLPNPVTSDMQGRIESTIMQAMSSLPTVNGTTVNIKMVVLNDNNNLTF